MCLVYIFQDALFDLKPIFKAMEAMSRKKETLDTMDITKWIMDIMDIVTTHVR